VTEPSSIPGRFSAGTTVVYRRIFASYSPDVWTLTLLLRGPSDFTKDAEPAGTSFVVTLTPEDTAGLLPGTYRYWERVTDGIDVVEIEVGTIVVDADPTQIGIIQSWAEKTLPVVEAAIAKQLTDGMRGYTILGRTVERLSLDELLRLRAYCLSIIRRSRTKRLTRPVRIHFPTPGLR
jgi:hypothetical protein